jgi:hypothetical protein
VLELPNDKHLARDFRMWLKVANVNRAELHNATPTRKALTFHDLRATGLTWMAIRGDDPLKIIQRAGHADFQTTQIYVREAEAVREGFGEIFPPLPDSLLKPSDPGSEGSADGSGGCLQSVSTDDPSTGNHDGGAGNRGRTETARIANSARSQRRE